MENEMEEKDVARIRTGEAALEGEQHAENATSGALAFEEDDKFIGEPWCRDFEGHKAAHWFCDDHQSAWCRICDKGCPACVDDPHCADCGCSLFTEEHDWDCAYYGD